MEQPFTNNKSLRVSFFLFSPLTSEHWLFICFIYIAAFMSFHQQVCLYMKLMASQSCNLKVCVFVCVCWCACVHPSIYFMLVFPPMDLHLCVCVCCPLSCAFAPVYSFSSPATFPCFRTSLSCAVCASIFHNPVSCWLSIIHNFWGKVFYLKLLFSAIFCVRDYVQIQACMF